MNKKYQYLQRLETFLYMIVRRNSVLFPMVLVLGITIGCKRNPPEKTTDTSPPKEAAATDTISIHKEQPLRTLKTFEGLADTTFVRLADFSDGFTYDLRYATTNNFLKSKVYDCPECYTRVKTAKALIEANEEFKKKGVRIKFFDCYRPNSVQYKM
ncbi:MAG: hypothetical protein MUO53_17675, partial [Maribacter sp.]|nr:hypothetical protein [Maribacter sp.]